MSEKSAIGWTDATWNPVTGCSRVSPGCEHCYAETLSLRMGWSAKPWTAQNAAENVKLHPERLRAPLRWREPRMVFVNSMSDLFHELVPFEYIAAIFGIMAATPQHTYQILTKRQDRMLEVVNSLSVQLVRDCTLRHAERMIAGAWTLPLPNVWLGVSVEDQRRADERIPKLLDTPAAVRFISAEPLLGSVDLYDYLHPPCECELSNPMSAVYQHDEACPAGAGHLDWVIVGGESGANHRPMEVAWAEEIAAQCGDAVALFVKQDSGPRPGKQGRLSDALWSRKEYPVRVDAETQPKEQK